jgi:4a-hydroxytetrahydrobiopterin dehydratase
MSEQINSDLSKKHCVACEGGAEPLNEKETALMLTQVNNWSLNDSEKNISKVFKFKNYYETIAFVNSIAWISHQEDHHPDLVVAYSKCEVHYSTHAIGGLSANDFICAAKIDDLLL